MGQKDTATVIVLPQTDENTLCVELRGLIRRDDHKRNLHDNIEKMVARQGWFKMLVYFGPEYQGWEHGAAEFSMGSIIDLGKYARKLAYINPPEKKILQNKLAAPLLSGEIRYFDQNHFQDAVDWIKA